MLLYLIANRETLTWINFLLDVVAFIPTIWDIVTVYSFNVLEVGSSKGL